MVVWHLHKFWIVFVLVDVAMGENMQHIYIYDLICGNVALGKIMASLQHFKLKMYHQM